MDRLNFQKSGVLRQLKNKIIISVRFFHRVGLIRQCRRMMIMRSSLSWSGCRRPRSNLAVFLNLHSIKTLSIFRARKFLTEVCTFEAINFSASDGFLIHRIPQVLWARRGTSSLIIITKSFTNKYLRVSTYWTLDTVTIKKNVVNDVWVSSVVLLLHYFEYVFFFCLFVFFLISHPTWHKDSQHELTWFVTRNKLLS